MVGYPHFMNLYELLSKRSADVIEKRAGFVCESVHIVRAKMQHLPVRHHVRNPPGVYC